MNYKELAKQSNYARNEIKEEYKNNAFYRWQNKKVYDEINILDINSKSIDNISKPSYGSLEIDKDAIVIKTNNKIEGMSPRPGCGISIKLNHLNLYKYNRVVLKVYLEAIGQQNMYFHFFIGNDGEKTVHTASIEANKWNDVIWEVSRIKRNDCNTLTITPFLFGCPSEGIGDVKISIKNIKAQTVDSEYELGWALDDRIAYSHVGYFKNAKKIAIVQNINNKEFKLVNNKNEVVYKANAINSDSDLGKFYTFDFSDYKKKGIYHIEWDDNRTNEFEISDNPYLSSILKSLSFLRTLRCGEDIKGVHSACHIYCKTVDEEGNAVSNNGGWHDAGDLSQFEICTAEMAHALSDLAFSIEDKELKERIMEEAKVGSDWLLKTTFHNGNRALAVSYKIWRDNLLLNKNKDDGNSKAENGPFENFLSAAALASIARLYKDDYKIYSDWCLRVAIEDFNFAYDGYKNGIYTKRWGPNIDSVVCGHGIVAATELYKMTNDNKYLDIAKEYADIVMSCQEVNYPKWEKPIRGFFYEDSKHAYILTYEHRGHEQSPIQGIVELAKLLPNDVNYKKWIKCIKLYREYVVDTMEYTKPYSLMPGHVYILDKLNINRFTFGGVVNTDEEGMEYLRKQVVEGVKLGGNAYLRRMPIAIQRRGYHATLLSKTKAISEIASLLNDKKLMQIAIDQLEWILGKNPFASSTMFGEGYNYHPLYVAFSNQMMGALPVGIETYKDSDEPYWPTINNAVYKEIWGHTTGKYLWVLADILKNNRK